MIPATVNTPAQPLFGVIMNDRVDLAFKIAAERYAGLVDKSGKPIMYHALDVAAAVRHRGELYEIVALLHDAYEESDVVQSDWAELLKLLGRDVYDGVKAMTIKEGEDYELQYLPRVLADPVGRIVKLADSQNNYERLVNLPDGELKTRLKKKYENVFKLAIKPKVNREGMEIL